MRIAVLGTRGIPNHYGGFEQFAEFFSVYAAGKGHEVYVYNSHNHPYTQPTYKGVNLIRCNDPEHKAGTLGQFIYDLNCIRDSRKRNFDVILQLGYTSSSVWFFMLPKKPVLVTNMDGLEWKRSKYPAPVRQFLKFAERLGAKTGGHLVADSKGIQASLKKRYGKESTYIAYGAAPFTNPDENMLLQYGVVKEQYTMVMARFEPENNIDMVLQGVALAKSKMPVLVIGNHNTKYGEYLKAKYKEYAKIRFIGAVYNMEHLNNLRYFSMMYFHGHSVGGTNPSLLEAMASGALIAAHNNEFNKGVLNGNAFYFSSPQEVTKLVDDVKKGENRAFIENNRNAITNQFNWDKINGAYLQLFEKCIAGKDRANAW